jgi:hypothetical protein
MSLLSGNVSLLAGISLPPSILLIAGLLLLAGLAAIIVALTTGNDGEDEDQPPE